MNKKYLFLTLILFLVLNSERVYAQESQATTSTKTLLKINEIRKQEGLKPLIENQEICTLAKLVATEKEISYPKKTLGISDPKYKIYKKDFSKVGSNDQTTADILVKAQKLEYKPFMKEDDLDSFAQKNNEVTMYADLTDGCVAISPGGVGYKQFGIFVGGVKTTSKTQILNFIELIRLFLTEKLPGFAKTK